MATESPPGLIWGRADPIMRFEIAAARQPPVREARLVR
jgi:hypothetical protein